MVFISPIITFKVCTCLTFEILWTCFIVLCENRLRIVICVKSRFNAYVGVVGVINCFLMVASSDIKNVNS